MVRTALARIKQFKQHLGRKWILHRHGYKNWDMYVRMTDPDIFWGATNMVDFYHGYPYVYCIENRNHLAYHWEPGRDGDYQLQQWCRGACKDKFRVDWHRVSQQTPIGNNGVEAPEWWIDEFGGVDHVFAAFKSQCDYTWFALRWS
jgi:hypothetical protein